MTSQFFKGTPFQESDVKGPLNHVCEREEAIYLIGPLEVWVMNRVAQFDNGEKNHSGDFFTRKTFLRMLTDYSYQ